MGLCLGRHLGESLKVGDDSVTVVEIRNTYCILLIQDFGRREVMLSIQERKEILPDVKVLLVDTRGRRCRLLFDAPECIKIYRLEKLGTKSNG